MQIGAGVAGANKHVRKHHGPADGAAKGIAEPRAVGNPAIRAGIGKPAVGVFPNGRNRVPQRPAKGDEKTGNYDDPKNGNIGKSLYRVGQCQRFQTADHDVDDDDETDNENDTLVRNRTAGGNFRSLGDGNQDAGNVREGSA